MPGLEDRKLRVRIRNVPAERTMLVRNITADYIGKIVAAEGVVRQTTMIMPKLKVAKWACRKCGRTYDIVQDSNRLKKPLVCVCGSHDFELIPDQSVWVDFQRIQIQEPIEFLRGGEQARFIDVYLEGDLVNKVKPGDRITVIGVVRLIPPDSKKTVYGKYIDALWVEQTQKEFEELEPTPEEIEEIKKLAADPEIYEKLRRSIAPTIWGHDDIKEAAALQLFGGVKKHLPDGSHIRGNIHILLMGDPGTGKSQILRHVAQIAPKSIYVAGKTASGAGLTATQILLKNFQK
jgi:replicative DNA helicase Mcm